MTEFKPGHIWKDKEGHNWLVLMIDKDSMCCFCGSRANHVSYLNLNGTHRTNDGCNLIEFVGEFKTNFIVKIDYSGHQFLTVEAKNESEARSKAREIFKKQNPEAYIRSTEIVKGDSK